MGSDGWILNLSIEVRMSFDPARFWIDPQAEKQIHPLPAVSHFGFMKGDHGTR